MNDEYFEELKKVKERIDNIYFQVESLKVYIDNVFEEWCEKQNKPGGDEKDPRRS